MTFEKMNSMQLAGIAIFVICWIFIVILHVLTQFNKKPDIGDLLSGDRGYLKIKRNPEQYLNTRGLFFFQWQRRIAWIGFLVACLLQ